MTIKAQEAPAPFRATAPLLTDEQQLVLDFGKLDGYGRRVALALLASLVRLGAVRAGCGIP